MARADAGGHRAALLLVDLDDFKAVNDPYGHPVGDRLLVSFAERLAAYVRKGDARGALGGDEFARILDNVSNPATVGRIAQAVVQAARRLPRGRPDARLTASVGSAIHRPCLAPRSASCSCGPTWRSTRQAPRQGPPRRAQTARRTVRRISPAARCPDLKRNGGAHPLAPPSYPFPPYGSGCRRSTITARGLPSTPGAALS